MKKQEFKASQFIQGKNKSIDVFGIIADCNEKDLVVYGMFADMEDNFGTSEAYYSDIDILDEETIRKNLSEIANNQEKYPWFIIQLNDIEGLSDYHIRENEFVHKCRLESDNPYVKKA